MERRTQNLTLKLLIFETTAGRKTFTDEAAEELLLLFPQESPWCVDIRKIQTPAAPGCGVEPSVHYEVSLYNRITMASLTLSPEQMRLVRRTITTGYTPARLAEAEHAIETLCRDFCDPAGASSPRKVNPNDNLVFTVGVDVNNRMDDIFLRSFLMHSARNAGADCPAWKAKGLASSRDLVAGVAISLLGQASKAVMDAQKNSPTNQSPTSVNDYLSTVVTSAGPAALKALVEVTTRKLAKESMGGDAEVRSQAESTTATLDRAILSFAGLDRAGADYRASGAIDLAGSTRQYLESLRDSISDIAGQRGHMKSSATKADGGAIAGAVLLVTSLLAVGCNVLFPNVAQALTASGPELLQTYLGVISVVSGVGTLCFTNEAAKSRDVKRKLNDAGTNIHRRLYLMARDALRSDYRYRPDAAVFARLTADMAALVDPAALEGWAGRPTSIEELESFGF